MYSKTLLYYCLNFSLENNESGEALEAIRNLVLIIASLSMSGYIELKPSQDQADALFQLIGFTFPQPTGRGEFKEFLNVCYYIFL